MHIYILQPPLMGVGLVLSAHHMTRLNMVRSTSADDAVGEDEDILSKLRRLEQRVAQLESDNSDRATSDARVKE